MEIDNVEIRVITFVIELGVKPIATPLKSKKIERKMSENYVFEQITIHSLTFAPLYPQTFWAKSWILSPLSIW